MTQGSSAGWTGEAEITLAHTAAREGVPVLVVGGRPVPIVEAAEAGYRVVEASDDERRDLQNGGYRLPDVTPATSES